MSFGISRSSSNSKRVRLSSVNGAFRTSNVGSGGGGGGSYATGGPSEDSLGGNNSEVFATKLLETKVIAPKDNAVSGGSAIGEIEMGSTSNFDESGTQTLNQIMMKVGADYTSTVGANGYMDATPANCHAAVFLKGDPVNSQLLLLSNGSAGTTEIHDTTVYLGKTANRKDMTASSGSSAGWHGVALRGTITQQKNHLQFKETVTQADGGTSGAGDFRVRLHDETGTQLNCFRCKGESRETIFGIDTHPWRVFTDYQQEMYRHADSNMQAQCWGSSLNSGAYNITLANTADATAGYNGFGFPFKFNSGSGETYYDTDHFSVTNDDGVGAMITSTTGNPVEVPFITCKKFGWVEFHLRITASVVADTYSVGLQPFAVVQSNSGDGTGTWSDTSISGIIPCGTPTTAINGLGTVNISGYLKVNNGSGGAAPYAAGSAVGTISQNFRVVIRYDTVYKTNAFPYTSGFTVQVQGLQTNRTDYFSAKYVAGLPALNRNIVL